MTDKPGANLDGLWAESDQFLKRPDVPANDLRACSKTARREFETSRCYKSPHVNNRDFINAATGEVELTILCGGYVPNYPSAGRNWRARKIVCFRIKADERIGF